MSESAPKQLALPTEALTPEDELILSHSRRPAGNFDGSRNKHTEERIQEMLRARAEGLSVKACARRFKMSEHTVLRLEEQRTEDVATINKAMAADYRTLSRLAVSRMIEEINDMPRASLPVVAGVATDKSQVLQGEPSMIVGHTSGIRKEADDLNAMIAALPAAEIEEVKTAAQPVLPEGARGKKSGGDAGANEAGEEVARGE